MVTCASSAVLAGLGSAVVNAMLAPLPREAGLAHTVKVVDGVDALASVGTRRIGAVVDVDVAQLSAPARRADATGDRGFIR